MDIFNSKVNSIDELFSLSLKSNNFLQTYIKDKTPIIDFEKKHEKYFNSVWVKNPIKIKIILNSLNSDQLTTYFNIFDSLLLDEGSISTIDAGPGTGKTFLTACILMSYRHKSTYMVYTNKLCEAMSSVSFEGVSLTCCKFLMNLLDYKYTKVKHLWNVKQSDLIEKCKEVENLAKSKKPVNNLYILDENSVVSPFFIYYLYFLHKLYNIHLIFIGDRYQQNSINATRFHNKSNYEMLKLISNVYNLSINVRQNQDQNFINMLNKFITYFQSKNTSAVTFDVKYFFYNLLKDKFHVDEDFKNIYFAQYHVLLKLRLDRYEEYLKKNSIKYEKAYIYGRVAKGEPLTPLNSILDLRKFKPYLTLVIGSNYIYSPNNQIYEVVTLKEINENNLKVFCHSKKRNIFIRRLTLNASFTSEQLLFKLQESNFSSCKQFPLRELVSTYHAAQGLTISNSDIELNMDCQYINSFYVGITRINKLDQLKKIHSEDVLNLAYTKEKNDEYFYKIVEFPNRLKDLEFAKCRSVKVFENAKRNLKIEKSFYDVPSLIEENDTNLMTYIRFNK
ncbi:Helicase 2 [Aratus pisonii nudivirus]|nr:Helicase 2 [Aratus pisonii nudivirus]